MPAADHSIVARGYQRGRELAASGRWFDAHEAFEEAWRAAAPGERDFFQGLVHVVVSAYQHGRGRAVGAERQRLKALHQLAAFAPAHRDLDVAALLAALPPGLPISLEVPQLRRLAALGPVEHARRLRLATEALLG